jgi:hypothetical protein
VGSITAMVAATSASEKSFALDERRGNNGFRLILLSAARLELEESHRGVKPSPVIPRADASVADSAAAVTEP